MNSPVLEMTRRRFVAHGVCASGAVLASPASPSAAQVSSTPQDVRGQWLKWVETVSTPVLHAASSSKLRVSMPVEAVSGHEQERAVGSPLEALGRLLAGLAPWLELRLDESASATERALQERLKKQALSAISSALDPASPDYMRFGESSQTLVDSSFLSLALLRAPNQLLAALDSKTKRQLVYALLLERKVQPPFTNWLLFAALNEVLLLKLGAEWDRLRIDYALREHESWYVGDGVYGDGPQYHADYYNSYVIQPYLLAVLDGVHEVKTWQCMRPDVLARSQRYAEIQERTVASDGSFPLIGRSLTYRAGAFHLLADACLRGLLSKATLPGAVRSALTAVQERTLDVSGTFSREGWLQIGVAGHQPSLAETYISTGSLYLCSVAWLPLGLGSHASFWASPTSAWTQKRLWTGESGSLDHALSKDARTANF